MLESSGGPGTAAAESVVLATPENTFIQSVHRHLPVSLYRMKNHNQYAGGISDCWYSGPAGDLWIEYKFVVLPKRVNTLIVPNLSALQIDWLNGRSKEGCKVGVIIGCKDGGVWLPGLAWADPLNTAEFCKQIQSRSELAYAIKSLLL